MTEPRDGGAQPLLRVVRGDPSAEELAALVAVLAARAAHVARAEPTGPPPATSAWRDHSRSLRTALPHGPDAWRASAWPR